MPKMKNGFNMAEFKKIAKKFTEWKFFGIFGWVVFKNFTGFC